MSASKQRWLGLLVFVLGISLAGIYAARPVTVTESGSGPRLRAWLDVAGGPFAGGLLLMIVGALVARRAAKNESAESAESEAGGDDPPTLVAKIAAALRALPTDSPERDQERLKEALEEILESQIPAFLEHRVKLMESLGLESFAEMISNFAVMERNTARAWSALTDEHWSEVPICLEEALVGIDAVQQKHLPAPPPAPSEEGPGDDSEDDSEE